MDDEKPLRRLFARPEKMSDVGGEQGGRVTPLKLATEAQKLEAPLDRILAEVVRKGRARPSDLSDSTGVEESILDGALDELELQGYLASEKVDGEEWISISSSRAAEEFPSGPIIPLVYQYNLLSDGDRLGALNDAIEQVIRPGDVVADLGSGAGVLSFLAADRADKVYAVEVDREVHERSREILSREGADNVEHLCRDARNVQLPEPVDVVMCEMLDTGLAAELQVPVMNYAVESLLADGGRVIPRKAVSTVRAIRSDYSFHGGEFRLPHFEEYGSRESMSYSRESAFHRIEFDRVNDLDVESTVSLEAERSGIVNGIQLRTYVQFGSGMDWTGASPWLNPPLNLPLAEDLGVEKGQTMTVSIRYRLGGGLNDIECEATTA